MSVKKAIDTPPATSDTEAIARLREGLLVLLDLPEGPSDFDPGTMALAAIEQLQLERDAMRRQITAQKGQTTRARNQVAALESALPAKPRNFGLPRETESDLAALVDDAEEVELVMVGPGGMELPGVKPWCLTDVTVRAMAGGRFALPVPGLRLSCPEGAGPLVLGGYVLLIDGKLVAHSARFEPLTVHPGRALSLDSDVVL